MAFGYQVPFHATRAPLALGAIIQANGSVMTLLGCLLNGPLFLVPLGSLMTSTSRFNMMTTKRLLFDLP